MARLKIMSTDELSTLYEIPRLEDEDRPHVFDLDQLDLDYIQSLDITSVLDKPIAYGVDRRFLFSKLVSG